MPCQPYKDALIDAAASGAEPQGELRAHLADCTDCRTALEQEQSLFASIDACLQVAANSEVPTSLLPRVRARIDEKSAPRRIWLTNWLVLASAAAIIVAFFAARSVWRTNVVQEPVKTAANTSESTRETLLQNRDHVVVPPAVKDSPSQPQLTIAKNRQARETLGSRKAMPEVLVPRDQEVLLAEYAEQWSVHKHPLLLAKEFDATILSPLQVAPIQIDELGVKPLAEEKSQ